MAKLTEEQKKERALKREAAKKEQAAEEAKIRKEEAKARALADLRSQKLPIPRYLVKAGDTVLPRTARWKSLIVKEVLDEGRILLCEIHSEDHNYGNPVPTVETRYVSGLDVLPADLELNKVDFTPKDRWTISFHNRDLFGLIHYHYSFNGIDYSPVYQRELVWSQADKESLIHSIFTGVEIGKFALIPLPYHKTNPSHEILDGKQRLTTLVDFYEDKFTYRGLYFSQLSFKDKNHFLHYNVTVGLTREEITLEEKMDYFLKMNVGGVPQSQEHLAKVAKLLEEEKSKVS